MYTIAEIIDLAVQIEENGEHTYREARQKTASPTLAQVFGRLAEEEGQHREWFLRLKAGTGPGRTQARSRVAAMGQALLRDIVGDQVFSLRDSDLSRMEHLAPLLRRVLGFEEDTALFYEMLAGITQDPQASEVLERIIAEEQRHARILKEILAAGTDEVGLLRRLAGIFPEVQPK